MTNRLLGVSSVSSCVSPNAARAILGYDSIDRENERRKEMNNKFNVGDRVRIVDDPILGPLVKNKTGTVTNIWTHDLKGNIVDITYTVKIDGLDSNLAFYGCQLIAISESSSSIKKVIFNGDRTIILWADGTKTMVKCADDENFDYYSGFCAAVTKKIFGSTAKAQRFMESKMEDQNVFHKQNKMSKSLSNIVQTFDEAVNKIVERIEKINALISVDDMHKELLKLYAKYDADKVDEALKTYIQNHKK